MAVRAEEQWSRTERFAWLFLAIVLGVSAIKATQSENDEHNRQFASIISGLAKTIQTSNEQFQETMNKNNAILDSTKKAVDLSKKNLENITGGESFAFLRPQVGYSPVPLSIRNEGKNILTGVTVKIYGQDSYDVNNPGKFLSVPQITIGTLHPKETRLIPGVNLTPSLDANGWDAYQIDISAQNDTVQEHLIFRKPTGDCGAFWEYSFVVERGFIISQTQKETKLGYKTLIKQDWWPKCQK